MRAINTDEVLKKIRKIGIIPVVAIDDAKDARALGEALCGGGLSCAEITFRTAAAEEAIGIMAGELPEMLVGAGTVLTEEQADKAAAAGAKFIVSPGLNPRIVEHCMKIGIPIIPGCANPSDIEQAIALGLKTVKFFPAEAAGGLKMIKAMSAPYGQLHFMATGGIDAGNLLEYLNFSKIIACGGSFMVPKDAIAGGDFRRIETLTREAVRLMLGFSVKKISFYKKKETEASAAINALGGMSKGMVESLLEESGAESEGVITVNTNSIERTIYQLESQGLLFSEWHEESPVREKSKTACLREKIGGFKIAFIQQ